MSGPSITITKTMAEEEQIMLGTPEVVSDTAPVEGGKKRKRTGKQREEAKKAAIQVSLV